MIFMQVDLGQLSCYSTDLPEIELIDVASGDCGMFIEHGVTYVALL